MNGIYEIFRPRNGTMRMRFHCAFDIGDLRLETEGVQRAEQVSDVPSLTPPPAINLDGSDMVRMSWPEDRERDVAIQREMSQLMRSVDRKVTAHILRDPPCVGPNRDYWANDAFRGSLRTYGQPGIEKTPITYPSAPVVAFFRGDKNPGEAMRELNLDWSIPRDHTIQATPTTCDTNTTIPDVIG